MFSIFTIRCYAVMYEYNTDNNNINSECMRVIISGAIQLYCNPE